MSKFEIDRDNAEPYERQVMETFINAGHLVQRRFSGSSHDLFVIANDRPYTLEVKNETRQQTKNLCIECLQGKPPRYSGILRTEATITVHVLEDSCIFYRSVAMRNYVWDGIQDGRLKLVPVGDNDNQVMLLPRIWVSSQPWADQCNILAIPASRLFHHGPVLGKTKAG